MARRRPKRQQNPLDELVESLQESLEETVALCGSALINHLTGMPQAAARPQRQISTVAVDSVTDLWEQQRRAYTGKAKPKTSKPTRLAAPAPQDRPASTVIELKKGPDGVYR